MEHTRNFVNGDRYLYDNEICSYKKGWAQVDTPQDASYFGTWTNPYSLTVMTFAEGDETFTQCNTQEEYVELIRSMCKFYDNKMKIDAAADHKLCERFTDLGLNDLIH